jgi:hypothetical protein
VSSIDRSMIVDVEKTLQSFIAWLRGFGETSYDHQSFFAGPIGGAAKSLYYRNRLLGTAAVAPMIFCEAFVPSARRFFGHRMRFPIADAHYAMGFAYLTERRDDPYHRRAVTFLEALLESRSGDYKNFGWGYPFDWVTRSGTIKANTPFITSVPYVYEAFRQVYEIDRDERWLTTSRSIAAHGRCDIKDIPVSESASSCGYSPDDNAGGVVNAAAYRAWLLAASSLDLGTAEYWDAGQRNLNFVLQSQNADGSWYYSVEGARDFVDHFHTCFVLKALAKITHRIEHPRCEEAIAAGVNYYVKHLLDDEGLPKPFSKAPRFTVYKRELYDYAECINLCVLLRDRHPLLNRTLETVLRDLMTRWRKRDGSFRSRELMAGWDDVPMHRWAQSQIFRSLAFLMHEEKGSA